MENHWWSDSEIWASFHKFMINSALADPTGEIDPVDFMVKISALITFDVYMDSLATPLERTLHWEIDPDSETDNEKLD